MYRLENSFRELLEIKRVKNAFELMAPDVANAGYLQFLLDMSVEMAMGYLPLKRQSCIQTLIDIANGKEVEIIPVDLTKELPELVSTEFEYDVDEVDSAVSMLDKCLSGCLTLQFTKRMNETVCGQICCNGQELPEGKFRTLKMYQNTQQLAVPIRQLLTEYNKDYTLMIQGFCDMDGNVMPDQKIHIHTKPASKIEDSHKEHDEVALEAAREGIVLLKNDNHLLPLQENKGLFVMGEENFRIAAVGAGKINPRYQIRLKRGIEEFSHFYLTEDTDTALIVISRYSGENYDNEALKGGYYLSNAEEEILSCVTQKYSHVIAVISSGYPMDVRWLEQYSIEAALYTGFSGMQGGRAVVEILDGRITPSGRLTDTWSKDYWDIPSSYNFYQPKTMDGALDADCGLYIDTVYEEGLYTGYRYFETFQKEVAYPFGFGLSYTDFNLHAAAEVLSEIVCYDKNFLAVTSKVTNIGNRYGKVVVQIYAVIPNGKLEQPVKRLVGFAKTRELKPGESQILLINVKGRELASFDDDISAWILEKGVYQILIGSSVQQVQDVTTFQIKEDQILKRTEPLMLPPQKVDVFSKWKENFPAGKKSGIKEGVRELNPKRTPKHYPIIENGKEDLVSKLSIEELARLSICASHGWGMQETGVAGKLYQLKQYNMPAFEVADGNNGLNIHTPNVGMPCSSVVCASWNQELAEHVGKIIAEEALENGVAMVLAPAMNLHRNPLGGRNVEYFSEDPYLTGIMAGFYAKGLEKNGASACMKHVIANNSEASRKRNQSIIDVRTMRELYLKSFEIAMDLHKPDSIMTSYNAVNGCYTAEDEELLEGIFRREFGFQGFVMTDWNSYDTVDIVKAVRAGNSWMTPGTVDDTFTKPIIEGVKSGKIELERLQKNIRDMLQVIEKRTHQKIL